MSDEIDLAELERLEREAMPAPWKWESESGRIAQGSYLGSTLINLGDRYEKCDADCVLLAALRNAAPELLTRARRLSRIEAVSGDALTWMRSHTGAKLTVELSENKALVWVTASHAFEHASSPKACGTSLEEALAALMKEINDGKP